MTNQELTDLMRRAADDLDPAASRRILERAVAGGERKRFTRHLAVGGSSAAALGVVATIAVVVATTGGGPTPDAPVAAASNVAGQPSADPTYSPGSETEVPGGPVVPTDRTLVSDTALAQVLRDLLPAGSVTGLDLTHVVGSGDGGHLADTNKAGRMMSFHLDGAAAYVAVGRWDGYHAVGSEDVEVDGKTQLRQKVATTAREACGGSYRTFPAITCTQAAEGWYSVMRPNAGGAVAGAKELWVELYTDDGYVVRVHSLNTAGEKQGPKVADEPVIDTAASLTLVRSPRWFTVT